MTPDEAPNDPLPALIADIDQMLALSGQMARIIRGYYEALLEEGFTEDQALRAAVLYVKAGS